MAVERQILEVSREAGFDLAGIAPLRPPRAGARFERWLAAGRHAGMAWLERQRERILDPRRIVPGARSLLCLGLSHGRPAAGLPGGGRVARYAAAPDYHNRVGRMLAKLRRSLGRLGVAGRRAIVDAGPLLERSHAAEAGIGFESKAANLLHPEHGPWFFLAELVLEPELEPTGAASPPAPPAGSCGTCTACLDACPTGALVEPGVLDANLCISYHTIENRGSIPHELRGQLGEWAFGCDVCSEVCPWGADAPDAARALGTHPALEQTTLVDWLSSPPETLAASVTGSALRRARPEGLARNAALVLGNAPTDPGREALLRALEAHPSSLVREASLWALARGHGSDRGTPAAMGRAVARETDADARAGMERTLRERP